MIRDDDNKDGDGDGDDDDDDDSRVYLRSCHHSSASGDIHENGQYVEEERRTSWRACFGNQRFITATGQGQATLPCNTHQ